MEESLEKKDINQDSSNSMELLKKIKDLEIELKERNSQFLYLKADIDNLRKNNYKEIEQQISYKMNKYSLNLLNFMDDLERFLDSSCKNIDEKTILEKVINKLLSDLHITEIKVDKIVDPEICESLYFTETEDENLDDQICSVLRKGYKQNGTIIRPVQVNVFKYKKGN